MLRMILGAVLALFVLSGGATARAETRVALVVANANYAGQPPLPNASADSIIVQAALTRAGFDIVAINDADFNVFNQALAGFMAKAENADIAMVYYAGHGLESGGRNWLIPTNAVLSRDRELMFQAVALDNVMLAIGGAKVRIVVLDACRNNPFTGRMQRSVSVARDSTTGLGKIEAPRGSMVMYSAAVGQTASDGPPDGNSPFAVAFARRFIEPGVDIRLLAGKIADDVFTDTREDQLPFYNTSLGGNALYLIAPTPSPLELEMRSFKDAEAFAATGNCAPMREHVARFANGISISVARAMAASCTPSAPPATATPAAPSRLPAAFLERLVAHDLRGLTDADYAAAALRLGVSQGAIKTVVRVESGAAAFAPDGRPVILFEPHIFSRRTNRAYDASHPDVSYPSWGGKPYPRTQADRWAQLRKAFALDSEAALASTAYGMFMMMGMQHAAAGFDKPSDFVASISRSQVDQLLAFEAYIRANGLVDELQRQDWEGFARIYNGPGQVERYGQLLRNAYEQVCAAAGASCPPPAAAPAPSAAVTIPDLGETRAPAELLLAAALLGLFGFYAEARLRRRRA